MSGLYIFPSEHTLQTYLPSTWAKNLLPYYEKNRRERERERDEPFMLETAFLTLLSQPSQSIFTLISTVCNTHTHKRKRKNKNNKKDKLIRFDMDKLANKETNITHPEIERVIRWIFMYTCIAFRFFLGVEIVK